MGKNLKRPVPYRSVALAILLVILGGAMLATGTWMAIDMPRRNMLGGIVRGWTMIGLGGLMFLPGCYVVRIVYYTWRGHKGFSYDMIPDD